MLYSSYDTVYVCFEWFTADNLQKKRAARAQQEPVDEEVCVDEVHQEVEVDHAVDLGEASVATEEVVADQEAEVSVEEVDLVGGADQGEGAGDEVVSQVEVEAVIRVFFGSNLHYPCSDEDVFYSTSYTSVPITTKSRRVVLEVEVLHEGDQGCFMGTKRYSNLIPRLLSET